MTHYRTTIAAALLSSTALAIALPAMAQTPATPPASAASASRDGLTAAGMRNQPAYNAAGREIGRIGTVVIGSDNQAYAVMSSGIFGTRQTLVPVNRLAYQNNRFVAGGYTEEQLKELPAYTTGVGGYRNAEDTFAVIVTGYTMAAAAGQPGTNIVVQQPAASIRVDQVAPQVTVQQAQPQVTVHQAKPEILVRQPAPTVTIDIPQPEIIVRMPRPDVDVAMAQPQVQVSQARPEVQVVQPGQPQVEVTPATPQVMVQAPANREANVTMQGGDVQPTVRYERAEPKVVVNQSQGQPTVRVEQLDQAGAAPAPRAAADALTTGALTPPATGQTRALQVSALLKKEIYNMKGEQLGDVERVLRAKDGKLSVVIGHGGFLGLGEKQVLIPVDRIRVRPDERLVVEGMDDAQIRATPEFKFDQARAQYTELGRNDRADVMLVR